MKLETIYDTQSAIKLVKDTFEKKLAHHLHLMRVTAPLFVSRKSGLNDNLNGVERPVSFDILNLDGDYEVVHSLAKWKRFALKEYEFRVHQGLYTDMNAIRRDEDLDNLHSIYVDQWDWEKVISKKDRNLDYLKNTVRLIVKALKETEDKLCKKYEIEPWICEEVTFITSQELLDLYPNLSSKEREDKICEKYQTVFIMQIGDKLSDGSLHDHRAPDYDDWSLNGDLLVYYPVLKRAVELSSMGIRVDKTSLRKQLEKTNLTHRYEYEYHKLLDSNQLPLTIGGGIGQSRLCMLLLHKRHIGEVQVSAWSSEIRNACEKEGIFLL